jgi:hypothetical protein
MSPTRKLFLFIALPLIVIFAIVAAFSFSNDAEVATSEPTDTTEETKSDDDTFVLQNLGGITLGAYSASTGMAGDILFSKSGLDPARGQESIFYMFGQKLPKNSADEPQRINPNFEFKGIAKPIDIIAAIDGIVVDIKQQSQSDDVELFIVPSEDSDWVVGYDHITDVTVAKGETVKVGQKLGVIAKENSGGYRYELQVNNNATDTMHCPTTLLAPTAKSTLAAQITQLATDWAAWYGKDVFGAHTNGCIVDSLTAAESEGR